MGCLFSKWGCRCCAINGSGTNEDDKRVNEFDPNTHIIIEPMQDAFYESGILNEASLDLTHNTGKVFFRAQTSLENEHIDISTFPAMGNVAYEAYDDEVYVNDDVYTPSEEVKTSKIAPIEVCDDSYHQEFSEDSSSTITVSASVTATSENDVCKTIRCQNCCDPCETSSTGDVDVRKHSSKEKLTTESLKTNSLMNNEPMLDANSLHEDTEVLTGITLEPLASNGLSSGFQPDPPGRISASTAEEHQLYIIHKDISEPEENDYDNDEEEDDFDFGRAFTANVDCGLMNDDHGLYLQVEKLLQASSTGRMLMPRYSNHLDDIHEEGEDDENEDTDEEEFDFKLLSTVTPSSRHMSKNDSSLSDCVSDSSDFGTTCTPRDLNNCAVSDIIDTVQGDQSIDSEADLVERGDASEIGKDLNKIELQTWLKDESLQRLSNNPISDENTLYTSFDVSQSDGGDWKNSCQDIDDDDDKDDIQTEEEEKETLNQMAIQFKENPSSSEVQASSHNVDGRGNTQVILMSQVPHRLRSSYHTIIIPVYSPDPSK